MPIWKKGEGERARDYRGVTIMSTMYKIYAGVLAERLRREMEEKGIVPENQTGFRKGKGTMDNIYVLNHIINRRIEEKGGRMIAVFVELKAAFDSVDRKVLWETMEQRGVSEVIRRRVRELYRETRSKVRVGSEEGKSFWTARGVRQGCPLSADLFNIMIADMEERLKKGGWGGG